MDQIRALVFRQLSIAWRYRWIAAAFAWLFSVAGWIYVFQIPNVYESSARVYVDADAVLTPLLRGIAVDNSLSSQLDVLQRTLLSRPNLEKLISKTDLELQISGPSDVERLTQSLAVDIKLVAQTKNLFTLTYRNDSAKLSYDVVQAILATFIESKTGNNRTEMLNAQLFLQQQINLLEQQLQTAEQKRAEFRTRYLDILPTVDGGSSRFDAAQSAVRTLDGQLKDAIARRESLTRELQSTPQQLVTETEAAQAAAAAQGGPDRLRDAERTLQELRLKFTDQHPDVIAQRNLVASIRASGGGGSVAATGPHPPAARSRTASNPVYEQLKVRLVENESQVASLQRQLQDETQERDRLGEIARSAPGVQAELSNLNRDYDVVRKGYADLLERRASLRLSTAAEADADKIKIQVIEPPQIPRIPVGPKRLLLISGVFLVGIAGGLGLALLLVQLDTSFHSTDDLRSLGLPVVGGISLLAMAMSFRRRMLLGASFASAYVALIAVFGYLVFRVLRAGSNIA